MGWCSGSGVGSDVDLKNPVQVCSDHFRFLLSYEAF